MRNSAARPAPRAIRAMHALLVRRLVAVAFLVAGMLGLAIAQDAGLALAQDAPTGIVEATEDKGRFIEFIEDRLSTDNRIIRVSGIEGALSSRATIDLITIADRDGVWLRLEGNVIDWSRRQLLRGRLEIERLASTRIEILRTPLPDPNVVPSPEAGGFSIPELPLSIRIDELAVGQLFLGEPLLGFAATLAIDGSIALADGGLDARLAAQRLDGPGGEFTLALAYAPGSERFTVNLVLDEPAGGIVAELANIEGRPPVRFAVQGEGPLDDLTVAIALDAAGNRLLNGSVVLAGTPDGRRITADLDGALGLLLPASVRDFVGQSSTLDLVAVQREGGGLTIERAALDSGQVQLTAAARTAADGFLELLDLEARIGAGETGAGERIDLPGGAASIAGATVSVDYGTGQSEQWTANVVVDALDAGTVTAAEAVIAASGTVRNPNDPDARALTFTVDGDVRGLSSPDPAIAAAIGEQLRLDATGGFEAGGPVRLESAALTGKALRAVLAGTIEGLTYRGGVELSAASLTPFSALAGRELGGSLSLDATGSLAALSGAFDLTLDGQATGLRTGIAAADELLEGTVTLGGRVARDETGFTAEGFTIDGEAVDVTANGTIASETADFQAQVALAELSDLSEQLSGAAQVSAAVTGTGGAFDVALNAAVPQGTVAGRDLAGAAIAFDGRLEGGDVSGRLSGDATLGGEPVSLAGEVATLGDIRQIEGLTFRAGEAQLTGTVRQGAEGLIDGTLRVDAADISTVAALALTEAEGSANVDVTLSARADGQGATVEGTVDGLVVGGTRVGSAEIAAEIADLFGVPIVDGRLTGTDIAAGGVEVTSLTAQAQGSAERTVFEAEAALANGTEAVLAGALRPLAAPTPDAPAPGEAIRADDGSEGDAGAGFALDLDRLALRQDATEVELLEPTTLTIADGTVVLDGLAAAIGGGTVRASGSVGETIDLAVDLDRVGLDAANAVRPDLAAAGRLSGTARVGGTPADPDATFELTGEGLSVAQLREGGVEPLSVDVSGTFADGTLRLPTASVTNEQGVRLEANALVPLLENATASLMANLAIERLPLSVANGFQADLGADGTASGMASVSGSLASPQATFNLTVDGATANPLREAGVEPVGLDVSGSFEDNTVRLSRAALTNSQGVSAIASGIVPLSGSGLDLDVELGDLPLSIGGVAVPDLGLEGRVTGRLDLTGTLTEPRGAFRVDAAGVTANPLRETGVAPVDALAEGELTATGVELATARITNEQGLAITAAGTVPLGEGEPLDLELAIDAAPVALANAFVPDLDLSGFVEGRASLSGTLAAPEGQFDVAARDVSAAPLREAGIEPITAEAAGELAGQTVRLDRVAVTNPQGLSARASGTVPLTADGEVDVDVALDAVPLAIAEAAAPDLDLSGTVSGTASVSGPLTAPEGTFDVRAAQVSAAPLAANGIAPLDLAASGALEGQSVRLDGVRVTNDQGLAASASGTVPLAADAPIDVDVSLDSVPLALGNAARPELALGGQVTGTASIQGALAAPTGTFDVAATDVTAAPLAQNGIAPVDARATGELRTDAVVLETARLTNDQGVAASASGTVPLSADGEIDIDVSLDSVPLTIGNAARPELELGGQVTGTASIQGALTAPTGTFDVAATDVTAAPLAQNGIAPVDARATGELRTDAVVLETARLVNDQGIAASASGTVPLSADGEIDIDVSLDSVPLTIGNAARPELELGGQVTGTASIQGALTSPTGTFDVAATDVTAAPLAQNGIAPVDARATGELTTEGVVLETARLINDQGIAASASGTVPLSADGEIDIDVSLDSVPLAAANAARPDLALDGTVSGTASVEGTLASPRGTFDIAGRGITAAPLAENGVQPLDLDLSGSSDGRTVDLAEARLTNPQGIGVTASGSVPLSADGPIDVDVSLDSVPLTIGNAVRPELDLDGRVTGTASVEGTLAAPRGTFDVAGRQITAAPLRDNGVQPLDLDLSGSSDGRTVELAEARLTNGQGISATASGSVPLSADGAIDVDVALDSVPLSIGNAARPELDLAGRVSGNASVAGTLASPQATFDVRGEQITAAPVRAQGLSPIDVTASGSSDGTSLTLDAARATNAQGIALSASGTVPFDPNAPIDLDVRLEALPLDAFNGGERASLGLGGRVTGTADVAGTVANPAVDFSLDGSGLTAAPLRENGIDPLTASVDGSFADNAVRLASATASNGQGIDVAASGTVPLSGGGLALQLSADAPLSLADRFLIDRGTRVGGQVQFAGSVSGSLADPSVNGTVVTQNASVVDPLSNFRVPTLDVQASVDDNVVNLSNARAVLASGGTVSATGTIDLLGPGVPADLTIVLDEARYTDGENIVTTVDGQLTVSGGLAATPLLAGTIDVIETNITVPESFGASADVFDVVHFRPPVPVTRTLERARVDLEGSGTAAVGGQSPSGIRLDLTINAPNRIFIRGRGLDAEVGGTVALRGPVSDVQPTGQFELIRGRLSILTQRITLDQGTVTLVGDLDPLIDFSASTQSGDVTVIISVTGRASDLDISFSSSPELPEDEVLARLIFDRGLDELSPLQIARLAAAAAELSGRGGPGIFDQLRASTGLDDLDVTTDAEGNTGVRAGRYINDNIYLGVEAGQGGGRVSIDLDITDNIKARASTGADESKVGVFFEKDF